jgi:hypothetical protein
MHHHLLILLPLQQTLQIKKYLSTHRVIMVRIPVAIMAIMAIMAITATMATMATTAIVVTTPTPLQILQRIAAELGQ